MKRTRWFKILTSVAIALVVALVSWVGLSRNVFGQTQLRLVDALFPAIGSDPRVAIVGIDEATFDELGFPFSRREHATVIRRLAEAGATVVGYDVTFDDASNDPEADAELADALADAGNVVLAAAGQFEGRPTGDVPRADALQAPLGMLSDAAAGVGHVNVFPDPQDGVVRALPPLIELPETFEFLPALSLQLYAASEGIAGEITLRPEGVQVGDVLIPTGPGRLMDINFAEPPDQYSFLDVRDGNVPEDAFRDKIVFVGATALGLGDLRFTPLDKATGQPGVTIHANALNTMLQGAYLQSASRVVTAATAFLVALLVALAVAFLRLWIGVTVALLLAAGYVLLTFNRFDSARQTLNIVYPVLAAILAFVAALAVRYFTEERERRRVTRVFGRYVAEDVVDEVLAAPERALATLEGAERPISILFADLRGFTAASEGASPKEVVAALNLYLDAMTRAVNEERGTIDKFMGDCVMAFWGAPRPIFDHASKAVRAAQRMLDYIDEARDRPEAGGLKVKGCGVGVATGVAVVGNIGSAERLDYTVIGDTVNTASRLCGVAGAGQVVVTEECAAALPDEQFELAPLPPLTVKGKAKTLTVFQVLREGQSAEKFATGAVLDATEDKGHFEGEEEEKEPQQVAPHRAASYAPVEPVDPTIKPGPTRSE